MNWKFLWKYISGMKIGLKWTIGSEDVESDRQKNKYQRIEKKCSKLGLMWRKPQTRVKTDGL